MTSRVPLWLSLLAVAVAVAAFVLQGEKITRLNLRVAGLERRLKSWIDAQEREKPGGLRGEDRRKAGRAQGVQAVEREIAADLAALVKNLEAGSDVERKLRDAIQPEIDCYLDAVEQSLGALYADNPKPEDDRLSSPDFRKELEERIGETDAKARELLSAFQIAVFEQWRSDIRKNRYKLE
jgi:hypothetical protein